MDSNGWMRCDGKRPAALTDGAMVIVALYGADGPHGPHQVEVVEWARVTRYKLAAEDAHARLLAERDQLQRTLDATRLGTDGALNLQRLFLVNAEVREARAQREYASSKLEYALLREQLATAISRGHLPADFHQKLREWSK